MLSKVTKQTVPILMEFKAQASRQALNRSYNCDEQLKKRRGHRVERGLLASWGIGEEYVN